MAFNFIGAISLGIFVYYCTRPIYNFLKKKNIGKTLSAIIAQLSFIIPSILLVAYAIQIIAIEIRTFISDTSGRIADILEGQEIIQRIIEEEDIFGFFTTEDQIDGRNSDQVTSIEDLISRIDPSTVDSIIDFSTKLAYSAITSISGLFFTLFIAFALSFYLQRDGDKLKDIVFRIIDYDRDTIEYIEVLDKDLKIVFLGNIALALSTGVLGATTFYLITILVPGGEILRYPGLIGFMCGIASLIPVVGMKLVYFPVTVILYIVSFIQNSMPEALVFPTVFFLVGLVIVDFIPDLIARPYLGSLGGVSTSILLFSYIFGPLVFGWYGLFFGPLVFVALYEFVIIILPKIIEEYLRVLD
jgi:predicted PurR-regulated permease PerM